MIYLVDKILDALHNGEYVLGLYLDFSKAFDTVNHGILLNKLEYYGIRGIAGLPTVTEFPYFVTEVVPKIREYGRVKLCYGNSNKTSVFKFRLVFCCIWTGDGWSQDCKLRFGR